MVHRTDPDLSLGPIYAATPQWLLWNFLGPWYPRYFPTCLQDTGCACGCACFHLFWAVLLMILLLWSFLAFIAGQTENLLYYVSPRAAGYGVFNTFQSFRECWYFLCRYIGESNKRLLFESGLKSLFGILSWTSHLVTLSITAVVSHILKHISADGITIHIFICFSRSCVVIHGKATVSGIGLAGQID